MRFWVLGLVGVSLAAVAQAQVTTADNPRALQLARLALQNQELQRAITSSPLASHPLFTQIFARVNMADMNDRAARMMAGIFTQKELETLVAFQNSPEGKSIQAKMPGFQLEVGAMVNNVMTTAFQQYLASQAGQAGASSLPVQGMPAPAGMGQGTPVQR